MPANIGISLRQARRIAVAAQGFADRRPAGTITARHLDAVIGRTALLQIDSVSVLARAHYLPLFSRLGGYRRALLETAAWGEPRRLFEYWAHEASLLPLDLHPLLRWRMRRAEGGRGIYGGLARLGREDRPFIDGLLAEVTARRGLAASDIEGDRGEGGWWGWSRTKQALEWLFWAGLVTTRTRRGFERVYDLPERVIPATILALPTPDEAEAHRRLLAISARALGIATASELRDYFRLAPDDVKPRLPELVETGELVPVAVEGWAQQAYLHRDARRPRRVAASALLAPFDPLVWERSRTERLFGFRYRIEIYTPAEKRVHGYYVLPFLFEDRLVARVDLKANKTAGALHVLAAHAEPDMPADAVPALLRRLREMASWLGLDRLDIRRAGDLAPALIAAEEASVP